MSYTHPHPDQHYFANRYTRPEETSFAATCLSLFDSLPEIDTLTSLKVGGIMLMLYSSTKLINLSIKDRKSIHCQLDTLEAHIKTPKRPIILKRKNAQKQTILNALLLVMVESIRHIWTYKISFRRPSVKDAFSKLILKHFDELLANTNHVEDKEYLKILININNQILAITGKELANKLNGHIIETRPGCKYPYTNSGLDYNKPLTAENFDQGLDLLKLHLKNKIAEVRQTIHAAEKTKKMEIAIAKRVAQLEREVEEVTALLMTPAPRPGAGPGKSASPSPSHRHSHEGSNPVPTKYTGTHPKINSTQYLAEFLENKARAKEEAEAEAAAEKLAARQAHAVALALEAHRLEMERQAAARQRKMHIPFKHQSSIDDSASAVLTSKATNLSKAAKRHAAKVEARRVAEKAKLKAEQEAKLKTAKKAAKTTKSKSRPTPKTAPVTPKRRTEVIEPLTPTKAFKPNTSFAAALVGATSPAPTTTPTRDGPDTSSATSTPTSCSSVSIGDSPRTIPSLTLDEENEKRPFEFLSKDELPHTFKPELKAIFETLSHILDEAFGINMYVLMVGGSSIQNIIQESKIPEDQDLDIYILPQNTMDLSIAMGLQKKITEAFTGPNEYRSGTGARPYYQYTLSGCGDRPPMDITCYYPHEGQKAIRPEDIAKGNLTDIGAEKILIERTSRGRFNLTHCSMCSAEKLTPTGEMLSYIEDKDMIKLMKQAFQVGLERLDPLTMMRIHQYASHHYHTIQASGIYKAIFVLKQLYPPSYATSPAMPFWDYASPTHLPGKKCKRRRRKKQKPQAAPLPGVSAPQTDTPESPSTSPACAI